MRTALIAKMKFYLVAITCCAAVAFVSADEKGEFNYRKLILKNLNIRFE